jgi:hypothetical protein
MVFFIRLTKKDQPLIWGVEIEMPFNKVSFTIAPFFIHVDPSKPFVLKTNTSDFAINIVLFQVGENNFLRLVDFCSLSFLL